MDRKKFLVVDAACVAIFLPTRGFEGSTFHSSWFSTVGGGGKTLISASLVSHCGIKIAQKALSPN